MRRRAEEVSEEEEEESSTSSESQSEEEMEDEDDDEEDAPRRRRASRRAEEESDEDDEDSKGGEESSESSSSSASAGGEGEEESSYRSEDDHGSVPPSEEEEADSRVESVTDDDDDAIGDEADDDDSNDTDSPTSSSDDDESMADDAPELDDDGLYGPPQRLLRGPASSESRELTTAPPAPPTSSALSAHHRHPDEEDAVVVEREGHGPALLAGIDFLRARHAEGGSTKSFCDVALEGGGAHVPAHKAVLAAVSPELEALVMGADKKGIVKLEGVDAKGLHGAIGFIYNGTVEVPRSELPSVLKASDVLHLRPLKDACLDSILSGLDPSNALKLRALGRSLPCSELRDAAHNMVVEEFGLVVRSGEFLELPFEEVAELCGSEDLRVHSEVDVLEAALSWVAHDEGKRKEHLLPLIKCVRLGLMSVDTLAKQVAAAPLIQTHLASDPSWQGMINAALAYVGTPTEQRQRLPEGPQMRQRLGSKGRYVFVVGGRRGSNPRATGRSWMMDKLNFDWYEVDGLLNPRKQHAAAELGGWIYAAGGWDGERYLRSVERFTPLEDRWERAPPLATPRGSFGMVTVVDSLLAAGGYDGADHLSSTEVYNASGRVWSAGPPLAVARSGLKLVPGGSGEVYAVGGFDGTSVLPTVERLPPGGGVGSPWRR